MTDSAQPGATPPPGAPDFVPPPAAEPLPFVPPPVTTSDAPAAPASAQPAEAPVPEGWGPPAGPTPAPAASDTAPGKQSRRPHPVTPLIRSWFVLLAFGIWWFNSMLPSGDDGELPPWWVIIAAVGVMALFAGVAGFLSWYFTKFVIDADEVRIETGWLQRRSKRIAIDRIQSIDVIQPLAARIFGLAELKIDVGAPAATSLRYLTRDECYRWRDLLLSRAAGLASDAGPDQTRLQDRLLDTRADERTIVTARTRDLVLAALLSSSFLTYVGIMLAVFGGGAIWAFAWGEIYAVPLAGAFGLIPLLIGLVSLLKGQIFDQFNYTMSVGPRGVKVSRGLTSLTSQVVPVHRIQGVRVRQSLLWRPFSLYRIDIDVLGYAATGEESSGQGTSSILLPAGGPAQAATALAHVLPGLDLGSITMRPADRGARWLRPWFWRGLTYGFDDRFVVTESGRWGRTGEIVPHARAQSVRVSQGPLQRQLGIATAHVDTTPGPVDMDIPHLALADAHTFAHAELQRSAAARAMEQASDARRH